MRGLAIVIAVMLLSASAVAHDDDTKQPNTITQAFAIQGARLAIEYVTILFGFPETAPSTFSQD